MATAVLELERAAAVVEIDAEIKQEAEAVLKQLGFSLSRAVNLFLSFVIARKKLPEVLNRPFIPSLDDMTKEEFDALIQEAFDDIDAGRYYTVEEVRKEIEDRYEASL